mmetsp:Transcript_22124/g.60748  ORF Transcript_22124/g.60748 Transcript_22124/m.60748 type:complete len:241 (-) Transcript_22124:249-971(-)
MDDTKLLVTPQTPGVSCDPIDSPPRISGTRARTHTCLKIVSKSKCVHEVVCCRVPSLYIHFCRVEFEHTPCKSFLRGAKSSCNHNINHLFRCWKSWGTHNLGCLLFKIGNHLSDAIHRLQCFLKFLRVGGAAHVRDFKRGIDCWWSVLIRLLQTRSRRRGSSCTVPALLTFDELQRSVDIHRTQFRLYSIQEADIFDRCQETDHFVEFLILLLLRLLNWIYWFLAIDEAAFSTAHFAYLI